MARSLGTLGDLFPDQPLACTVRGCQNMLAAGGPGGEPDRPKGMCDRCYAIWRELADKPMPCATPACPGTWAWSRMQQLEARIQGRKNPPPNHCEGCRVRRNQLQDKPVPCRIKGCKGTWLWTREEQSRAAPAAPPPARFCPDCFRRFQALQDKPMPCRIRGCTHTWAWNRYQQLEWLATGRQLEEPPHRLCHSCLDKAAALQPAEIPCRVRGCKGTWSFSPYAQLEHLLSASASDPVMPRMCPECFKAFHALQDTPMPCRHKGCPGTWLYTRTQQLQDRAAGRTQPVPHLCPACVEAIRKTAPKPMPCTVPGCQGSWSYSPADQVRDRLAGRPEPGGRRCPDCDRFLNGHAPLQVACGKCGAEFKCSSYEQLLAHQGASTLPDTCPKCVKFMAEQVQTMPHIKRPDHAVVRIPHHGRWNADPAIANLPPHFTPETIRAAEAADLRIACFGDGQTWSAANPAEAWPTLLAAKLAPLAAGRRLAVVNAGIPHCTSAQALVRLARDVTPFAPHLVIFSFVQADSWIAAETLQPLRPAGELQEAAATLIQRLRAELPAARLLFWTGTPLLPQDLAAAHPELAAWITLQEAAYNQGLAHSRHLAEQAGIPVADTARQFVVGGHKSAHKWMHDWHRHNAAGAENLATWLAAAIAQHQLLPPPPAPAAEAQLGSAPPPAAPGP
ncbi:MAG: SGNH/GDSL hydrolase family protein [Lentisphaeria bacterium]